jgi:hypothetical protein
MNSKKLKNAPKTTTVKKAPQARRASPLSEDYGILAVCRGEEG